MRRRTMGIAAAWILAPALAGCASDVRSEPGEEEAPPRALAEGPLEAARSAPTGGWVDRGSTDGRGGNGGREDGGAAAVDGDGLAAPAAGFRTHLYSERDADVYARLSGADGETAPIEALHAEVGDRVAAGALLATLDESDARLAVAEARPEQREAVAHHERTRQLHEAEGVSDAEHEAALFARERAEARLERALLTLERTRIRAPFAGVVSRRYVRVGETVDEARPLFRVTALAPLRARLLVPEAVAAAFRPGTRVGVEGVGGARGDGRVVLVGPTVDPGSGTREVVVELADPRRFEPGASVVVRPSVVPPDAPPEGSRDGSEPSGGGG